MWLPFLLILLIPSCLIQSIFAAPATPIEPSNSSTPASTSQNHITSTHSSESSSFRRVHPATSPSHSLFPQTHPTLFTQPLHPRPTPPFNPNPDHTPQPHSDPFQPRPHPRLHHGQKPILIVFEVLGGAVAIAFLLGFLRCCYNYHRTPKRDRIAAVLSRHQLDRELEELERNPNALRRPSFILEPAPPYFPPPPAYVTTHAATIPSNNSGTEYADVPTASPLESPPSPGRPLPQLSNPSTTTRPVALQPNG